MTRRKFTAKSKTQVVLEALKERKSMTDLAQKDELHPQQISNWKREFLDGAGIIHNHQEQHKRTFLMLYKFHFASISLLTIFSILTALCGFLIGQNGWKESSTAVKTLFLTFAALVSFYALSINVYKQDVGINKNLESFVKYDNVQKEILNFYATSPHQTINGDSMDYNTFHTYVTNKLIDINNIYLEFDKSAIKVKDYFE